MDYLSLMVFDENGQFNEDRSTSFTGGLARISDFGAISSPTMAQFRNTEGFGRISLLPGVISSFYNEWRAHMLNQTIPREEKLVANLVRIGLMEKGDQDSIGAGLLYVADKYYHNCQITHNSISLIAREIMNRRESTILLAHDKCFGFRGFEGKELIFPFLVDDINPLPLAELRKRVPRIVDLTID